MAVLGKSLYTPEPIKLPLVTVNLKICKKASKSIQFSLNGDSSSRSLFTVPVLISMNISSLSTLTICLTKLLLFL